MINSKYHLWLLIGLAVLFFFPFLGYVHLFDWDEINFAESAREMLVTGDYYRVRINYDPFWEKPPLFFWLQALSMKLFGVNEFAARFPNALFGVLTVSTLYLIGKKLFSSKFGLIWGLLYMGSFLPHLYFKSGIIDPVFNFFIFLGTYFLALNLGKQDGKLKNAIIGGTFVGLAIITKGPVGLLLPMLTFIVYMICTKFRIKISILDVAVFAFSAFLITSIWFGYEVIQNGPWFIVEFIKYQIELFSEPVAGHEQPFYYHFVVVLLGCFPMSVFAIYAFTKKQENIPYDLMKWMKILFWVVLILFSIVKTKIVHYSSMTYLPLSFIATYYVSGFVNKKYGMHKLTKVLYIVLGAIFSILLIITPILFYNKAYLSSLLNDQFAQDSLQYDMGWNGWEFLCGVLYLVGILFSLFLLVKKKRFGFIFSLNIFAGLTLLSYAIFVVPKIEAFSQRPAINFLSQKQQEDAYITTIGHKSYAHYFYGRVKPRKETDRISTIRKNYIDKLENKNDFSVNQLNQLINNWLLNGDIDKTAYFVVKSTHAESLRNNPSIEELYKEGGFIFFKRTPSYDE